MDVTDVLRDRMREPEGLQRMAVISGLAHAVLAALIVLAPNGWLSSKAPAVREVMTVSLDAGGVGVAREGLTPISGQAVQATPLTETARPQPLTAPAAATPDFVEPTTEKTRTKPPATRVTEAPNEAQGRTPTRGAQTMAGSAIADTGVRGQGFGLATGGGSGDEVRLDVVGTFCCPDYIRAMKDAIRLGWNANAEAPAVTTMKFTILRDGTVTNIEREKSSGYQILDLRSRSALDGKRLAALPAEYTNSTLTVHLDFKYTR